MSDSNSRPFGIIYRATEDEQDDLGHQVSICHALALRPGDAVKMTGRVSRIVSSMPPDQVLWYLRSGNDVRDIMGMTMCWEKVPYDTCGFVVQVIDDPRSAFVMYFVLIEGKLSTIFGFYDGIERLGGIDDLAQ